MKKLRLVSFVAVMLSLCVFGNSVVSGSTMQDDFALYVYGNLQFGGGALVEGNAVVLGQVASLGWDERVKDGKLFADKNNIPEYSGYITTAIDKYLSQNPYIGEMPSIDIQLKDFPVLENKESILSTGANAIISESGWYPQINIDNNSYGIVIDTGIDNVVEIRVDKLIVSEEISVIGSGIVIFYVNEGIFSSDITKHINDIVNPTAQIALYLADGNNYSFHNVEGKFSLYSKDSNFTFTGGTDIIGNIYTNGTVTMDSGSYEGYVAGNQLDLVVKGGASIEGRVVANNVQLLSDKIEFKNVPDINNGLTSLLLPKNDIPDEPEEPEEPSEYVQGILGEYYDAPETYNDSALRMRRIDSRPFFNWQLGSPDEVIEPEYFSVKWTGYIKTDKTAAYTFKTLSDDGVMLSVNNVKLFDNWGYVSLEYTISDPILLEAGVYYPIELEYQQLPYNTLIYLFWETEEDGMSSIPASAFYVEDTVEQEYRTSKYFNPISAIGTGLLNEFYQTEADMLMGNAAHEEIAKVDYHFGLDVPNNITGDSFYGTMKGYIEPKFTERLTLSFEVDDALRVTVDGVIIIDEWVSNNRAFIEGSFDAVAGQKSQIVIEYADFGGGATCIMRWESDLQKNQVVPVKYLYVN